MVLVYIYGDAPSESRYLVNFVSPLAGLARTTAGRWRITYRTSLFATLNMQRHVAFARSCLSLTSCDREWSTADREDQLEPDNLRADHVLYLSNRASHSL